MIDVLMCLVEPPVWRTLSPRKRAWILTAASSSSEVDFLRMNPGIIDFLLGAAAPPGEEAPGSAFCPVDRRRNRF